jgi:hypothetical protein
VGAPGRASLLAAAGAAVIVAAGVLSAGVGSAAQPSGGPTDGPSSVAAVSVAGTPCTSAARACVDLDDRVAWLIANGSVVRGPVDVMTGDEKTPTPRGAFHVQWKAQEYTSRQYLSQMPYSVFFADGGIAFHEGRQDTYSGGCVKLTNEDAVAWFDFLQVGDQVQVH